MFLYFSFSVFTKIFWTWDYATDDKAIDYAARGKAISNKRENNKDKERETENIEEFKNKFYKLQRIIKNKLFLKPEIKWKLSKLENGIIEKINSNEEIDQEKLINYIAITFNNIYSTQVKVQDLQFIKDFINKFLKDKDKDSILDKMSKKINALRNIKRTIKNHLN